MPKYAPLEEYLSRSDDEVAMTFEQIEDVIGSKLPPCAERHRAWWSNNPSNSSMTRAWLRAGFKSAQVDMERRRLVFRRTIPHEPEYLIARVRDPHVSERASSYAVRGRHPLFSALKGMIRLARGTDLTAPADPAWDASKE